MRNRSDIAHRVDGMLARAAEKKDLRMLDDVEGLWLHSNNVTNRQIVECWFLMEKIRGY